MKHIYRWLFLTLVFGFSLLFFGSRMGTKSFSKEAETVRVGEAALPTISVETCGETVSCLYGFTSNMDPTLNREDLIPIDKNQECRLDFNEYKMTIRRLKYELLDITSKAELDSGTINAFEKEGNHKKARLRFKADLKEETEYAVRVTLINNVGKRMYYYFRVKLYEKPMLSEKLAFIREFQDNTRSADAARREAVIPYLEMRSDAPSDTFGYINIHSNYRLVCWGDLAPETVAGPVITVTEFYDEIMTAAVRSIVKINADYGDEFLLVEENFRIRYLGDVVHLLNYERYAETLFDSEKVSLAQSDLKLGLIADGTQKLYPNADYSMAAFVRNGSLYSYCLADNTISTVFASATQYERMLGQQTGHDILVLKIEANGDMTFMVTGYRNRGSFEGRVGLFIYRYLQEEKRLEELIYVPMNTTYQILKETAGGFAYLNEYDVFFFLMNRTLYSYNLITEELLELARDIGREDYVFSAEERYFAYQEGGDDSSISILFPETRQVKKLFPKEGEYIRLLGQTENNLICGYGKDEDIYENEDNSLTKALYRVEICTASGEVKKEYCKEGYYVKDTQTDGNVIRLTRLVRHFSGGYREAESDYILIRDQEEKGKVTLEKRVTERLLTEYYISFPAAFEMGNAPAKQEVSYTVAAKDHTLRLSELVSDKENYYIYCYGKIKEISENVSRAILLADELVGTVIFKDGKIVWERGVKAAAADIGNITEIRCTADVGSVQAAVAMLLSKKGITAKISPEQARRPVAEILEQYVPGRVLSMSGVSLDEVLYYIWKGQPVLALTGEEKKAVVLVGYTARDVIYYDPEKGRRMTLEKGAAQKLFGGGTGFYFSFLPER